MLRRTLGVLARLVLINALFTGCDSPTDGAQPHPPESIGTMQVAIGATVREIPFSEARCTQTADERLIELIYVREVPGGRRGQRPRVLIARVREGEVLEAHAFVPHARVGESEYDMLTLIAKDVPGGARPDCRVDEKGAELEIVCNNVAVVPWLDAGERPKPSFKATLRCES